MLTIKNIDKIKIQEFHWAGYEWVLFGIDTTNTEYKFIFIPMQAGRYDIHKAQIVLLDRTKKCIGSEVLGYRLWTTDGKHTYLNTNNIPNWSGLVQMVFKNKMICLQ
jgi:hypothetical protein